MGDVNDTIQGMQLLLSSIWRTDETLTQLIQWLRDARKLDTEMLAVTAQGKVR